MSFVVEPEIFPCNFCNKSYNKESERNKHEKRSHKIDLDKKSSSEKMKNGGDNSYTAKFKNVE